MAKYYLLDENKNLVEGFDKEGFLALLQQAIASGSLENIDEESAVASKLRSVLNGTTHHIEFVTQAQYNQLVADEELVANTYYFITDDTTAEDLDDHITQNDEAVESLGERTNKLEEITTPYVCTDNISDMTDLCETCYDLWFEDLIVDKRRKIQVEYGQQKYIVEILIESPIHFLITIAGKSNSEIIFAYMYNGWKFKDIPYTSFTLGTWQRAHTDTYPTIECEKTYQFRYEDTQGNTWDFGVMLVSEKVYKTCGKYYIYIDGTDDPAMIQVGLLDEYGEPSETIDVGYIVWKEII